MKRARSEMSAASRANGAFTGPSCALPEVKLPKRVVDGEAIWTSRKLRLVEPEWVRGEFTNLLPLALANGVFELDADQIWARVYAYLRPSISRDDVSKIVAAFERSGLLFGWNDGDGKRWGFWIGIDKPGRLPRLSRVKGRHERLGPTPPKEALEKYVATQWYTNGAPVVSLGFGFGLGSGTGLGKEGAPETGAPPAQAKPRPSPSAFSGSHLVVSEKQDAILGTAFPWVDRPAEYRLADSWLEANPERRPKKTAPFLHNWFHKIQAPSAHGKGANRATDRTDGNLRAAGFLQ
jgi:hypothetical protein